MANQNDLPIWARILLGIPISDADSSDQSDARRPASDCQGRRHGCESDASEQCVLVFNLAAKHSPWCWGAALGPVIREFQS